MVPSIVKKLLRPLGLVMYNSSQVRLNGEAQPVALTTEVSAAPTAARSSAGRSDSVSIHDRAEGGQSLAPSNVQKTRKIIHIDMDVFFAAVEQRDDVNLRGRPVVVASNVGQRGVVAAASYEARAFGVNTAMPLQLALTRCPHLIVVPPRIAVYRSVSTQLQEIFQEYTALVEPLALDEAYLEVTEPRPQTPTTSATAIAQEIKRRVFEVTGLTCSAGVSINKFIAKVASGIRKPDGLTVVPPHRVTEFLEQLPIERFYGIGRVNAEKFYSLGVHTGYDLKLLSEMVLRHNFGRFGSFLFQLVRGRDNRPVNANVPRKSFTAEYTFDQNETNLRVLEGKLTELIEGLVIKLQEAKRGARRVAVKVKNGHFVEKSRQFSFSMPMSQTEDLRRSARFCLLSLVQGTEAIRLIGVTLSELAEPVQDKQLPLLSLSG